MRLLVRIAETGSLSAAGRSLGLSQPSASRQLRTLEEALGAQLIMRTTHELTFTEAGQEFLESSRRLLAGWEEAAEAAGAGSGELRGTIRVAAPMGLGQTVLVDVAAAFIERHSGVSLEWQLTDEPRDLVAEGYDLWIRVGTVKDESLIVRNVWTIDRVLVASAESEIECSDPKELVDHPAVVLGPYVGGQIELRGPRGEVYVLEPSAQISTDNLFVAERLMKQGCGYSILPLWLVGNGIDNQSLDLLCPGWFAPPLTLSIAYPQSRYRPKRVVAFIEHIQKELPVFGRGIVANR